MTKYFLILLGLTILQSCFTKKNNKELEVMYLNSEYEEITKIVNPKDNLYLYVFSFSKVNKLEFDTAGLNTISFMLRFNNFECKNSRYFLDEFGTDIDQFDFTLYNSNTLTEIAMDYELILECDLLLKDIFLREAVKQSADNIFARKELVNLAILSGKYEEALIILKDYDETFKNSDYYVNVMSYCSDKIDGSISSNSSCEELLKSNVFEKKVDVEGYTKFW
ncbi:MAG: tetratricopeptide repeat protein [Chitinophagales bacterium]|nr:tetratricopeptide repeat protein [Chitinophagales bacterium]